MVRAFYHRHMLRSLSVWLDPQGAAARAWGVRGLPTTLIVDRDGLEAARLQGAAAWDSPEMVAQILRLVEPIGPARTAT